MLLLVILPLEYVCASARAPWRTQRDALRVGKSVQKLCDAVDSRSRNAPGKESPAANVNSALGLGSIYPAAYPGDRLIENHHDALTDAKMLRNLVTKLEPAWGRGKGSEEKRKALQRQLRSQQTLDIYLISKS